MFDSIHQDEICLRPPGSGKGMGAGSQPIMAVRVATRGAIDGRRPLGPAGHGRGSGTDAVLQQLVLFWY